MADEIDNKPSAQGRRADFAEGAIQPRGSCFAVLLVRSRYGPHGRQTVLTVDIGLAVGLNTGSMAPPRRALENNLRPGPLWPGLFV